MALFNPGIVSFFSFQYICMVVLVRVFAWWLSLVKQLVPNILKETEPKLAQYQSTLQSQNPWLGWLRNNGLNEHLVKFGEGTETLEFRTWTLFWQIEFEAEMNSHH